MAKIVEGVLRGHVGDRQAGVSIAPNRRRRLVGLHPPKRVADIPEQWAQTCFDLLPIHEKLRTRDFPTTRNCVRVALCNIRDEFIERLDVAAAAASLRRAEVDASGIGGPLYGLRCNGLYLMR